MNGASGGSRHCSFRAGHRLTGVISIEQGSNCATCATCGTCGLAYRLELIDLPVPKMWGWHGMAEVAGYGVVWLIQSGTLSTFHRVFPQKKQYGGLPRCWCTRPIAFRYYSKVTPQKWSEFGANGAMNPTQPCRRQPTGQLRHVENKQPECRDPLKRTSVTGTNNWTHSMLLIHCCVTKRLLTAGMLMANIFMHGLLSKHIRLTLAIITQLPCWALTTWIVCD
jgi:hypothetical protein